MAKAVKTARSSAAADSGKRPRAARTKAAKPRSTAAKPSGDLPATDADATPPTAPAKPKRKPRARKPQAPPAAQPWLASYPASMPREIGPLPAASIGELLVTACRRHAKAPAFSCMGRTIRFEDLERRSAAFAAFLQGRGLARGARVALMMPNILQYPIAMIGVLRAGMTVVNVNPLYTPRELEQQLTDSGAEAIVILENFATTLQTVLTRTPARLVVVATLGDLLGPLKGAVVNLVVRRVKKLVPGWSLPGHVSFPAALREGRRRKLQDVAVGPEDIAFLQYTGGTTGISKGAVLLHRNVLANVAQNLIWMETAFVNKPRPASLTFLCALPLYHIYALTVNALMGMEQGAHNILIPNPRDIPAVVKEWARYPINVFPGLNTLFNALLNNQDFAKLDFKPLLLAFGGGMAVQGSVAQRWKALTGTIISEGYGLSETSPVATANRFDAGAFSGTIGLPIPSTEVSIRDDAGQPVKPGGVGELWIRGPQVMAGYWQRPEETAAALTADGFFKTGDLGFMNAQGFITLVDRKKDMILVSGFNVYPNEIEEIAAGHPGVLEVAAIGVPDERSGEVPKLFVVKKDPDLTADELLSYCRKHLAAYKRPRSVEFRTELPKTNVGKILRRELRS